MSSSAEPGSGGSVRERMLRSGKTLFSQKGYDNASTAAIARMAGSSESQLVKHFGGKQGLLVAIFDQGWSAISRQLDESPAGAGTPISKLLRFAETIIQALEQDPELKLLFLVESRRIHSHGAQVAISDGFLKLVDRLDATLEDLQAAGQLRAGIHPQAIRSALIGMLEGLLRDQFLGQRNGYPASYGMEELPRILSLVLPCFLVNAEAVVE